jgi:hypothetical protein
MYNHSFWSLLHDFFRKKGTLQPSKDKRSVVFESSGPSGYAILQDGNKSTKFYMEVGVGNCIFYISIPTDPQWESQTGFPITSRNEILHFLAEESLKKQARLPGSYYIIQENSISFMRHHLSD